MVEPIPDYVITQHAAFEISRRGLGEQTVRRVLAAPEQRILQARESTGEPPKSYLVRIFVDVDRSPAEVVTAYRTSKIAKYWRQP